MTMLSHLKLQENNYSANAPGDHILLDCDDAQSYETPRKNNHSVTAPSSQILVGGDDLRSF